MYKLIFFGVLLSTFISVAQPYNRVIRVNTGISGEQFDHRAYANAINDTGAVKFEFLSWSPTLSYTHEFTFGQILSLSGSVGFQYMNLFYGPDHYGGSYFYASVNPQLILFKRKKFEYYIKLRIGATFYMHNRTIIPEPARRLLPQTVNIFTGVTIGGFNYFITDKIGLNLELSIWSPEMATFGISYRFFKGELPEIQNENENTDL
ncbi:MAG: hypothetical protein WDZ35_01975 [Crocinitomicaceae bacterium]